MKLALITGITGQDGSYLAELLLEKDYKVFGIMRRTSLFHTTRIDHIRHKMSIEYNDLTDSNSLSKMIHNIVNCNSEFEVFEIYNLGAQSHVAISFMNPTYTTNVDAIGTLNLLEIINSFNDEIKSKIKFYQAGTSELFGKVKEIPQSETTPFNPVSPYAAAKQYAYYITKIYRESYNIYAVNGILFNHESPRRGKNFVTRKIIEGIKSIEKGNQDLIELGNI